MDIILRFFSENVNIINLVVCTVLNTLFVWFIVHFLYYPRSQRRDYYFSYILMSLSIFMLIFLLLGSDKSVGTGVALGLFAIFSIVRFRTEGMPIREMTYLFLIVALSVINGKMGSSLYFLEAAPTNKDPNRMIEVAIPAMDAIAISVLYIVGLSLIFILIIWVAELLLQRNHNEGCKYVKYDNIELIKPERYDDLVADLEKRLGVKVFRVEVGAVDFIKDMTMLRVFYEDTNSRIKSIDRMFKIKS